ncbi:uncharacterized protein LOC113852800 [Abrus precatorius]|uniref:Uncharacterized protein LOC113852800 n=1 Tax=Abrus precatorius TaxID=3816 RepID=A0A8B8K5E0_ABRPR|nr:uncharacterized protein LOC113852800 [Abrus precatorius]
MERMSSWGSAVSRVSLSVSQKVDDDDAESERVSEAGDIGDRALHGPRHSESSSLRLSLDSTQESGVVCIPGDHELHLQQNLASLNYVYSVTPLEQFPTPVSISGEVLYQDKKQELDMKLPKLLDYVSCLTQLAVFGVLGVLTRYLLEKLFGPGVGDVTSNQSILYPDLPSNMVGSFLMGWFGVVFKADISRVSEHLAIGLTTGYLGSLTTFSGWNQKMLELGIAGHWLLSVLGILIGLFLVAFSIIFGVETAKGFKWFLNWLNTRPGTGSGNCISKVNWKVDSFIRHLVVTVVFLAMLGLLWGGASVLERDEFKHGGNAAQLWFACIVGPLGVWIRWFLARLNGGGIGAGWLKWLPFGTLIANVSAACVMAALATVKKSVNTTNCDTIVTGIQFGLLGCLSTVSTFAAEFNAMRESVYTWRAYAYAMVTICLSLCLGILIYCTPLWRM